MDRREFVGALAGASFVWPNLLKAQQGRKLARIGLLTVGSTTAEMTGPEPQSPVIKSFLGGMRALGYVHGRDFVTEPRGGAGMPERYAELVAELVNLPVDVIVATGPMLSLLKKATNTISIVMSHAEDLLGEGLIETLAHPGGNFTGLNGQLAELNGKRLELLREFNPGNGPMAVVWDRQSASAWKTAEMAGRQRNWALLPLEIKDVTDIEPAFKAAVEARADGVLVTASAHLFARTAHVAELAARNQLSAIYQLRAFVDAGGLMSYAPSLIDTWRHAAIYVDRILKGEQPAEMPVEQLSRLELVINLKAAKALNRTVPPSLLVQATEVIE
jgi:putative tryptophan/tyrosine transport system substrate-binding protein